MNQAHFLDENAALTDPSKVAANHNLPLKDQLRLSVVLTALETIMQYDDDPEFRRAVTRRYLSITDPKPQEPDL